MGSLEMICISMNEAKVDIREALRYLRASPNDPQTRAMAEEMAALLEKSAPPRYVFREVTMIHEKETAGISEGGEESDPLPEKSGLSRRPGGAEKGAENTVCEDIFVPEAGMRLRGKLAGKMLRDCGKAILLACTLGAAYERLERIWRVRDLARAAVLDACGSALAEAGCEQAEAEIRQRYPGVKMTKRFSPGYGDLSLRIQGELLRALDAEKRLGITLTESCLMIPSKSVTAIIGLTNPAEAVPKELSGPQ